MNAGAGSSASDSDEASSIGTGVRTLGNPPPRSRVTTGTLLFDKSESDEISMGSELAADAIAVLIMGMPLVAGGDPDCWGK